MKITDAFLGEHGAFYALFDRLEQIVPRATEVTMVQDQAALLAAALLPHATMENDTLFSALESALGPPGLPVPVMRDEHREIEAGIIEAQWCPDLRRARTLLLESITLARDHFAKEEQVLFPLAERVLTEAKLTAMGEEWARRRGVRLPETLIA